MSKKSNSSIPWVVNTEHIIKWIQGGMPVRYKGKRAWVVSSFTKKGKVNLNILWGKDKCVNINDITLLIE